MNIHRVGLTIAGLATAATIAGAFVADGYFGAQQAAATAGSANAAPSVVYVRPAPLIAAAPQPTQQVITQIVPGGGEPGDGPGDR